MQGIWKCVGQESGTVFDEVDLSEGEWVDYDEKVNCSRLISAKTKCLLFFFGLVSQAAQPVGVSQIESEWARA